MSNKITHIGDLLKYSYNYILTKGHLFLFYPILHYHVQDEFDK
jgi:hypothetical protein